METTIATILTPDAGWEGQIGENSAKMSFFYSRLTDEPPTASNSTTEIAETVTETVTPSIATESQNVTRQSVELDDDE